LSLNYTSDFTLNQRLRKTIIISANASEFIHEEREIVAKKFKIRSDCQVELKRIIQGASHSFIAEGFGTREQLNQLTEEVRHFRKCCH